jgi:serine acetyltransferase
MSLLPLLDAARSLAADGRLVAEAHARRGARRPALSALADPSLWALSLLRGSAGLRRSLGSSFGLSSLLRVAFHIDVWTDEIGPGLRLPHPFCIVIGEGVSVGAGCTLLHNVTIQRGQGTCVADGAVLNTGATILAGSSVGAAAIIGAHSVVRGVIPPGAVAVGAPARVVKTNLAPLDPSAEGTAPCASP